MVNFTSNGYIGVAFFFILSGFVLSITYADAGRPFIDIRSFYTARFARIYPAYALALLLAAPFVDFHGNEMAAAANIVLLQSWYPWPGYPHFWNTPGWTLSVEAFFYLVFPFFIFFLSKLRPSGLWLLGVGASCAIVGQMSFNLETTVIPLPLLRLPEFVLGGAIGRLFQLGALDSWTSDIALLGTGIFLGGILISTQDPAYLSLAVVGMAAFIGLSATNNGVCRAVLSHRWLVLLGGASYSLYILQAPVRFIMDAALKGTPKLIAIIYQPSLIVLSIIVFIGFEEPARRMIRRLAPRPRSVET